MPYGADEVTGVPEDTSLECEVLLARTACEESQKIPSKIVGKLGGKHVDMNHWVVLCYFPSRSKMYICELDFEFPMCRIYGSIYERETDDFDTLADSLFECSADQAFTIQSSPKTLYQKTMNHPHNGTTYNPWSNSCQSWATELMAQMLDRAGRRGAAERLRGMTFPRPA